MIDELMIFDDIGDEDEQKMLPLKSKYIKESFLYDILLLIPM